MSRLLSPWETAQIRGVKRKTEEAEQRMKDGPRPRSKQHHARLIQAHSKVLLPKLGGKYIPAQFTVGRMLDMVEGSELVAERLNEMAAKIEVKSDDLGDARVTADGHIKISRGYK